MHTVALQFTLTREDLLDAFAARYRAIRRPWFLRWLFLGLLLAIGALGLALLVGPVVDGRVPVAAIALPLFPTVFAVMFAEPRLLYRTAVRQLIRGNPRLSQPMTVTVSPAGVSTSGATGETAANWTQFPYHTETEWLFVLFASDRLGGAVHVLPKRALSSGGDPEPLRALLASHSQRLG
jgi:hypothetical protein